MNGTIHTRLAILGCGALAEQLYLPALRNLSNARVTLLVDSDVPRRERLAAKFHVQHTDSNFERFYDFFDAAIIALPTSARQSSCTELLKQRKAILVEQPIALSLAECDDVIHASEQNNTPLLIRNTRRFLWEDRFVRSVIDSHACGRVERFEIRQGFTRGYPIVSDFCFRKEIAGGGVLIDTGFGALDCVLRWLGDFSEIEYSDDAAGGVEANALMTLRLQNGSSGLIELSRTRRLPNTAIIHFEQATLEVSLDTNEAKVSFFDRSCVLEGAVNNSSELRGSQDPLEPVRSQLEEFVAVISTGSRATADLTLARSAVRLIETCYRQRKPLRFPWAYRDPTAEV